MKQSELFDLMDRFDKSSITKLVIEDGGKTICLEKEVNRVLTQSAEIAPATTPAASAVEIPAVKTEEVAISHNYIEIKSPLAGVFYTAASPESEAFVKSGQEVKKGQTVCLVEAMKMMNEIVAPCDGIVRNILAENQDVVSFDQVLFEVEEC